MSEQYQHPHGKEGSLGLESSKTSQFQKELSYNHGMRTEIFSPTPKSLASYHYPHQPLKSEYPTQCHETSGDIQRTVLAMSGNVKTTNYPAPSSPSNNAYARAEQKLANKLGLSVKINALAGSPVSVYQTPELSSNLLHQVEHREVSERLLERLSGVSMSQNMTTAFPRSAHIQNPQDTIELADKKAKEAELQSYQKQPRSSVLPPLMTEFNDHGVVNLKTLGVAHDTGLAGSQSPDRFTFDLSDPFVATQNGLRLGDGLGDSGLYLRFHLMTGSEPLDSSKSYNNYLGPIARPKYGAHIDTRPEIAPNPGTPTKRHQSKSGFETAQEAITMDLENWSDNASVSPIRGVTAVQVAAQEDHARHNLANNIPYHVQQIAAAVQGMISQIDEEFGPRIVQPFRPSYKLLRESGLLPELETHRSMISCQHNSSANYQGDVTISHNRSAEIPESQNCALWILGLPAQVTYTSLLKSIRGVGNVFATVINRPTGKHRNSAAKLVFFERHQAEKLVSMCLKDDFKVMGETVSAVRWNKIKSSRYPHPEQSRAIRITGSKELMNFDFFETFFRSRFTYELDWKGEVACHIPGMIAHEWHFGSLRCQAGSAKSAIERELRGPYIVQWVPDPCAGP